MTEDISEDVRQLYYNKVVTPEPFLAISNMIFMHDDIKVNDPEEYAKLDTEALTTMNLFNQFFFMPQNIAKAKTLYVDKDLMPSLINTDNEIFIRNTGLPVMFINEDIPYANGVIKGIMIVNSKELAEHMEPGMLKELEEEKQATLDDFNTLLFLWVYLDFNDMTETWMSVISGNTTNKFKSEVKLKYHTKEKQDQSRFVATIACNIIDLMNHDVENIDINIIETSREENEKRIRKGKTPVCKKVYIKPKSEVRNYYVNFNTELKECGRVGHKFLVRGHVRHFRSSKWKNKKGTSIWIHPQIKGKGIFIEKQYKLEDRNGSTKSI